MPSSQTQRVLVVGGGITGSVLSLALSRKGVDVVLLEIREEWTGIGHGITLQGNALKVFRSVGVFDEIAAEGYGFDKLRMFGADGHQIMEIPTPPMGGSEVPPTMGAMRSHVAAVLSRRVIEAGVDVRLGATVTGMEDRGDHVAATLSDGSVESFDLIVGADGIRSKVRKMMGIDAEPFSVGMGIWRAVTARPSAMDCSGVYFGGPKYKAGYTPIAENLCYAFLIEGELDRAYIGEHRNGAVMKEHGQGYGGVWGEVRDGLADDAIVNYQYIEAIRIDEPWHRGRSIVIGDAAHACPPLIAQGAAMCAEDAVVLAEMLTGGDGVEEALHKFMERRLPRVRMVLDNSLLLAEWEIRPDTPGADPGRVLDQTLHAMVAPA
ncbi:FAD-dependent oxidoreductase [Nonomuraea monospora]|uniref:FAD-dependent oxidoreductase n=1 Tax=Nonomuraea monospora TaxID=568818 RepID=A0ABP5PYY0_9ACTN